MTLLNTWALWFLAIIPIIVILYLLKVRRRVVSVPTLMFWQSLLEENRRRALFQRLRQWLSLLLHLLIFLLILAALAKPVLSRFARDGSSSVIIVDARARMQVREGNKTRMDLARELARQYAGRASARNEIALLILQSSAEVVAPFTGDGLLLRRKIAALEASDASGSLVKAVSLAQELLRSRAGDKRIIVLSPERLPDPGVPFEQVAIGNAHDNVAISRFAARPLPSSPQTHEVLLELKNYGDTTVRGNVEIQLDADLLDVRPFSLEPGEAKLETFPLLAENIGRGLLLARLDTKDALPVDDRAYAVVPPPSPQRVLLVTRGNWFLEKMLAADDQVRFELLTPEAFALETAGEFDAVILDNFVPGEFDLNTAHGSFLFIGTFPFAHERGILEQPIISEIDAANPLMRLVDWQNVSILRANHFDVPQQAGWQFNSPLRAIESPLVITGTRKLRDGRTQRLAAFAFDLTESDLPLRVAFPLLMRNTLQWLAQSEPRYTPQLQPGELL
jgi:hypothetical protein